MDLSLTSLSQSELLAELDTVEGAIARGSTFVRFTDEAGRPRVRVSRELLELAEREQVIVSELQRRRLRYAAVPAA